MRKAVAFFGTLALVSLLTSAAQSQDVFEKEPGLYSTKELKANATSTTLKRIVIRSAGSLSGSLTIETSDVTNVEAVYAKQARTSSRSKGIDYIDLISAGISVVSDEIRFEMRAPNPAPWKTDVEAGMVEARLTVPRNSVIEIDAVSFDVTASGPFKSVVIPSSLGRIDISDVSGTLDVTTVNQKVTLSDISGDVSASTTNSTLAAKNISCPESAAKFRNDGGDIKIDVLTGGLNIKNRYGRIIVGAFEPKGTGSFIRNSSGPISVEIIDAGESKLAISNEFEDIELSVPSDLSATLSLKVDDDGTIEASQFPFRTDLVEHNRLNLRLGSGRSDISAAVRGKGNIYVRGEAGD